MTRIPQSVLKTRAICHAFTDLMWQEDGWGNVAEIPGGFTLRVTPVGLNEVVDVQIALIQKKPSGLKIRFYRKLDKFGGIYDENDRLGRLTDDPLKRKAQEWVLHQIAAALEYAELATDLGYAEMETI